MTSQTNTITLQGSAQTVVEYLHYGINSILFQRGIYPPEDFIPKENYGITVLMSKNEKVKAFLANVLKAVKDWLPNQKIEKISLVVFDINTKQAIERWEFTIQNEDEHHASTKSEVISTKPLSKIQAEIRTVMRQITSTISFLPLIENSATFDVMIHPKSSEFEDQAPQEWAWASAHDFTIANAQSVKLRSFSTGIDKVDTAVVYRMTDK